MEKALRRCDVAIGALRVPHGRTPCVVNEDMIKNMKEGSVIVDVSIDKEDVLKHQKLQHIKNQHLKNLVLFITEFQT